MTSRRFNVKGKTIFLALLPSIAIFVFIVIIPLILSVRFSLYSWSGGPNMKFIGLANYKDLLVDENFWYAFRNNLYIIALCVVGQIGIPLLLCGLLISKVLKFKEFHRTVIFIPVVLSAVVIGFLWSMIYSREMGILNWFLQSLNMGGLIRNWLDDPKIVLRSVSAPLIWQYIGVYLVIFMSAIQGIPKSVLEVAEIDGAIGFKKLRYVVFPLISDTIKVAIMLCISGNMKVFDHIYIMTGGGPGKSSMVMAQYAYNNSFEMFKLGYGSTISVGILILSLTLIMLSRKLGGAKKV